jgi:diacylglycerol kinase (ATP)
MHAIGPRIHVLARDPSFDSFSVLCGRASGNLPANMRAAAIFGPGSSAKDLKPFQRNSEASWIVGLPADSNDADAILIFGGDGTIHRYLAQVVKLRIPVLVVPCGSGNDFARALKLGSARDSLSAWCEYAADGGNVRGIDLGTITSLNIGRAIAGEAPAPHYFCCVAGVGLDAEVARSANRLPRWLRAHGGYALSFLPALLRFAPIATKVTPLDSGRDVAAQPAVVVAVANAPTYGGGMKIAPRAKLDDGALDVCVIPAMSKLKLGCLFPTVYFGRHLNIPQVEYFQTDRLRLETERPLDVYADGEYVCQTPIEVSVVKQALSVIVCCSGHGDAGTVSVSRRPGGQRNDQQRRHPPGAALPEDAGTIEL